MRITQRPIITRGPPALSNADFRLSRSFFRCPDWATELKIIILCRTSLKQTVDYLADQSTIRPTTD
ncbi:MAG: hypothetical protein QME62_12790, partial [Armatimonadota bacterium]|nr:hypothetical protein [Armatimonadota bacterium]